MGIRLGGLGGVTILLAACMGTPTQYKQIDVTTPAGNTTAMVGVYSPPEKGADGQPIPREAERPFHMVPHDITTPGGTRTVYVREYE